MDAASANGLAHVGGPRDADLDTSARLQDLVEAAGAFDAAWYPDAADPDKVQAFWFAAKYPRERKFFNKLCRRFGPALDNARCLLEPGAVGALGALRVPALLRLAVFLDQQPRNMRAVESGPRAEEDVAAFDTLALACVRLAISASAGARNSSSRLRPAAAAAGGDSPNATDLPFAGDSSAASASSISAEASAATLLEDGDASAAQLCFFTLVLRHTRSLENVRLADRLLCELAEIHPASPVVAAFRRENRAALMRLEDEAYVSEALRDGVPEQLVWAAERNDLVTVPAEVVEGSFCLAPSCRDSDAPARFLEWIRDGVRWGALAAHPLCAELRGVLQAHGLASAAARLLLSFSGGVDSTAHLLLLLAAVRARGACSPPPAASCCGDAGPRLCCLLLLYPNRDAHEVELERRWAAWICWHLAVDLHCYHIRLARPHGEVAANADEVVSGLTREEYERFTKELRFRMYRLLLGDAPPGTSAVILGHHLDDVDENRLDHLQKGHFLGDVEGMRELREILDVPLLRPLLRHRKADFLDLLDAFPVPFLRDSTPPWSVRGATRALLDSFSVDIKRALLVQLDFFGRASAEVGAELDASVARWADEHVREVTLPRGAAGLVLDLHALLKLDVGSRLGEIAAVVDELRAVWNPAVVLAREVPAGPSPIAVAEIPPCSLADTAWVLFERGFVHATSSFLSIRRQGHYHTSEGGLVNRKATRHLYDNIRACQKPEFSGGLTQELGYLHILGPQACCLVLYDTSAHPGVNFKDMRGAIIKAVQKQP